MKSPNYSDRIYDISFIVIHYTEMVFEDALEKLCDPDSKVSCHYLIKDDGTVLHLVEDKHKAWHAGASSWNGFQRINEYSIGIELDNSGIDNFSEPLMQSCIELCSALKMKYKIPSKNIIGHSDVAPDRKIDPGIFFDWERLSKEDLGLWSDKCSCTLAYDDNIFSYGDSGDIVLQLQKNLKQIGYQIELTSNFDMQTNYVIRAFQAHFVQPKIRNLGLEFYRNTNSLYVWDSGSQSILHSLL